MTTMEIDKKIEKFIKAHHVLTLATATYDGEPYCCNCFFAYDNESAAFIFTSGKETHHAQMMEQNSRVAASIVLETRRSTTWLNGALPHMKIRNHTFKMLYYRYSKQQSRH